MEQHVKIVAILSILLGFALAIFGAALFVIIFGAGALSGDGEAMWITGTVGTAIGGFFMLMSLPSIIGGFGLLKYRMWARVLIIVVAVLSLPGFPFGTAYGVYALYALLNREATPLFAATA